MSDQEDPKLKKLREKQEKVQAAIRKIEQENKKRATAEKEKRLIQIGSLAEKAGILHLENVVLVKEFEKIAKENPVTS